jgi:diguanylate cyclase (GGDEF)-like protein
VAVLALCGALGAFAQNSVDSLNADQLLQQADKIKYIHNDKYLAILKQLDAQSDQLTDIQRDWLAYFHAWQLGYGGEYEKALAAFQTLLSHTQDQTIRARSRISLIYDQINAAHLEDAYAAVSDLLEPLPQVRDHNTHFLILATASFLYDTAGQYDLALSYVDRMLAYDSSDHSVCLALSSRADILYTSGKLHVSDPSIQQGIDACQRIGNTLYANGIRIDVALSQIEQGRAADALKLLEPHDAEVLATRSATTISEFRSALARAYFATGDLNSAQKTAQSAIAYANTQTSAKSVASAYDVLYQVAKRQGDDAAALAWHEKYAAADKGYLNDVSARALAYQMVHQRVLDNQRQLEAANDANKLLALQQQVEAQKARTRLLYMLLLLSGLLIIGGWAYRTKRSQIKFQKLARRDGLTGIFNRQHFFDSAQEVLRYCAKASREACVLVMDLDHFKSVNDMHGHAAGDDALKRAVAACQVLLRSIDVFGRLGGEEFAILFPDCPLAVARQRADAMRESIAASRREGDAAADVLVTASFGVAATQDCGYNLATLLAAADDAMYSAKRAGRNRVKVYRVAEPVAAT